MVEIAIYGKGGIGKSTISANLSAAISVKDKKVLQVGCDPKHDSTRLLLHGFENTTVLDYLKVTAPDKCRAEDIVYQGFLGVHCVEAGGPDPGVGCAGRGILTTFELLDRLGLRSKNYDTIVYDVLGDVVCGGFAVPMRSEYADQVYIITSGEYMSIYAANNILRGLRNYDFNQHRAGGIIFNARNVGEEYERVERFAEAVGLPILTTIPRSDLFANSEKAGCCLLEYEPESDIAKIFYDLAENILNQTQFYPANPLSDSELEEIVLGRKVSKKENALHSVHFVKEKENVKQQFFSKNLITREPLHGCAFSGAMGIGVQFSDAVCIAHGPKSCAHIAYQAITSTGRKSLLERGIVLPMQVAPPIVSSEMNEGIMVFGGIEELKEKIIQVKKQKPSVIFILTTCPSGIIGDDVDVVRFLEDENTKIIPIKTDGNITGDFLQGVIEAYIDIGRELIDRTVTPEADTVNIIGEKTVADITPKNYKNMENLLNLLGIKINCRYIYETSLASVSQFLKGTLNILAYSDYMGRTLQDFLQKEYAAEFLGMPFPVGFEESGIFVNEVARYFNKEDRVEKIIEYYTEKYKMEIERLKPALKNKKLMIVTYNHNIEWILQTAVDLEMQIEQVGILNYSQDNCFSTKYEAFIGELSLNYDQNKRRDDIERLKPDLVLANYTSPELDGTVTTDTIPLCPEAGFMSGIEMAKRWCDLFKLNLTEGWRLDEKLYLKYFA